MSSSFIRLFDYVNLNQKIERVQQQAIEDDFTFDRAYIFSVVICKE